MINDKLKKVVSLVGTLLMVVSLVFIAGQIMEVQINFAALATAQIIIAFAALTIVCGLYYVVAAINYRFILYDVTGVKSEFPEAVKTYCAANLYKYIPGGVLAVLGRNRLALENEDLRHSKVAVATVIEGGFFMIAAVIIALGFSFEHTVAQFNQVEAAPAIIAVVIGVLAIAIVLIIIFRRRISDFFRTAEGEIKLKPAALAKRMLFSLVLIAVWGVIFALTLKIIGLPMTGETALTIIGLYNLSWLVGFVIIVVPAGFGVREAAILLLMGGFIYDGKLLLAIMAHRIVLIVGDVLAFLLALGYAKIAGEKQRRTNKSAPHLL